MGDIFHYNFHSMKLRLRVCPERMPFVRKRKPDSLALPAIFSVFAVTVVAGRVVGK